MTEPQPNDPTSEPTTSSTTADPSRSGPPWPLIAIGIAALAVVGWLIVGGMSPAPRIEPALRLVAEGKYDEAEAQLSKLLAYDPGNFRARIAMADTLLDREKPRPADALKQLEGLRFTSPMQEAMTRVRRGKAEKLLSQFGKAEADLVEALRLDPFAPEAGWLLIELYYTENRVAEGRELALRLAQTEPDMGDRVRMLLEPMRFDAEPLAAAGVIPLFKDAVQKDPDDIPASIAYYGAKAREGVGIGEAQAALRALAQRHPENLACRVALLRASTDDPDAMEKIISELPKEMADRPEIARFRGQVAMSKKDYEGAIRELNRALEIDPSDKELLHRLAEAYKLARKPKEAEETKAREDAIESAREELRGIKGRVQDESRPGLFEEASRRPDLGIRPDPVLYQRLADVRERMGHPDEALAWHKLVLRALPSDPKSLAAVARLEKKPQ